MVSDFWVELKFFRIKNFRISSLANNRKFNLNFHKQKRKPLSHTIVEFFSDDIFRYGLSMSKWPPGFISVWTHEGSSILHVHPPGGVTSSLRCIQMSTKKEQPQTSTLVPSRPQETRKLPLPRSSSSGFISSCLHTRPTWTHMAKKMGQADGFTTIWKWHQPLKNTWAESGEMRASLPETLILWGWWPRTQ